jgi:hypothetical protein
MKKTICLFLFIPFLLIFFNSCQEEYDKAPEVEIQSPSRNQLFQYGDTIFIRAKITDEIPIKSVSVALLNEDRTPRTAQLKTDYDAKSINYYEEIPLNISKLETGNYFIHLFARNEYNSKSIFLPISIKGMRWQMMGAFMVTKISEQQTGVILINELGNMTPFATLQGDFLASGMNIEYQSLVISGKSSGDLSVLSTIDGSVLWSIENSQSTLHPYFQSLMVSDNRIFSGQHNSTIQCYDFTGGLVQSYSLPGQRHAKKILFTQNRLFAETQDVLGGARRLIQFYGGSSSPATDHTIIQEIVSWDFYNDRVLIFANVNNAGKIYTYNYQNNQFTLQKSTETPIVNATKKEGSHFFVACQDAVYLYDASVQNTITKVIQKAGIKNVFYSDYGGTLLMHDAYNIYSCSVDTYQIVDQFVSPNEILNIHGRFTAIVE